MGELSIEIKVETMSFLSSKDARGGLVAIEGEKDIPFAIKRIFYIFDCDPATIRGAHANRNSQFIMICIHGSVHVRISDGKRSSEFVLDRPDVGLYLSAMTWKEMYAFSEGAVLLVLSSEGYDPEEYIRNFEEFVSEMSKGG